LSKWIAVDADFDGYELSENITETPEGYLVCKSVPFARTGIQHYMGEEMGQPELSGQVVSVYRLEEDVFADAALRSFEGKPITNDHPAQALVTIDNYASYSKGHIQNVRREGNFVIGDMVIKDAQLIEAIKSGRKRQVSAGYVPDWIPYKDGFKQVNIRGNHVAVVERGRAGAKVCIKDTAQFINVKKDKRMNKKTALAAMFAAYAKDASPEEIAAVMPFLNDAGVSVAVDSSKEESLFAKFMSKFIAAKDSDDEDDDEEKKKKKKDDEDKAAKDALTARVAELEKKLAAKDEENVTLMVSTDDPEEAKDIIEEILEEDTPANDAAANVEAIKNQAIADTLKSLKPAMAKLKPQDQKAIKDALRGGLKGNAYGQIQNIVQQAVAADSVSKPVLDKDLGKQWAEKFNPHYKKA
jgi:hypothetical protein